MSTTHHGYKDNLKVETAYAVARYLLVKKGSVSALDIANSLSISVPTVESVLNQLKALSIVTQEENSSDASSSGFSLVESAKQGIEEAVREIEIRTIVKRVADHKIDVVGRLQWIDDAHDMIKKAKESRNEALRQSKKS